MKLTKKLLPALGMLALSACMMVTSTFAWFSMNDKVSATGMAISAKGNQIYLQIKKGDVTADPTTFWQNLDGVAQTTDTAITSEKLELQPVNIMNLDSTDNYIEYTNGEYHWVTATGVDAENGAAKNGAYTPVTQGATGPQYYLANDFSIRLDPTAGKKEAGAPLKVAGVNFKGADVNTGVYNIDDFGQCVSVLVVSGNNAELWKQEGTNGVFTKVGGESYLSTGTGTGTVFADANSVGVKVTVYVFFDGEHDNCTLEELAKIAEGKKYAVEVSFTVA